MAERSVDVRTQVEAQQCRSCLCSRCDSKASVDGRRNGGALFGSFWYPNLVLLECWSRHCSRHSTHTSSFEKTRSLLRSHQCRERNCRICSDGLDLHDRGRNKSRHSTSRGSNRILRSPVPETKTKVSSNKCAASGFETVRCVSFLCDMSHFAGREPFRQSSRPGHAFSR